MDVVLYLGLNPPAKLNQSYIHFPVIKILPKHPCDPSIQEMMHRLQECTHLIFTSKSTVTLFMNFCLEYGYQKEDLFKITLVSIGQGTANRLKEYGFFNQLIAKREQAEGIVDLLKQLDLTNAILLWPHSNQARSVIVDYLSEKKIQYLDPIVYETVLHHPKISFSFDQISSIFFTSPSTVDGFLAIFKKFPSNKTFHCIGPITQNYLNATLSRSGIYSG